MIQPGYPMTLGQIFADNARYMADEPAIVCGDARRTLVASGKIDKKILRAQHGAAAV